MISPLLANIALHGLETHLKELAATLPARDPQGKSLPKRDRQRALGVIRYADDFVILHKDRDTLTRAAEAAREWLKDMGLEINEEKTRLVHTLHETTGGRPGFHFLGFNVRQYPVGKHRDGKLKRGYKTLIKPQKEKIKKHHNDLKAILKKSKDTPDVIMRLNPVIRG